MRYKPIGWRFESQRHSLAAKGIKTSFIEKDPNHRFLEVFDSPEDRYGYGKAMTEAQINSELMRLNKIMTDNVNDNIITDENNKRFLDHTFAGIASNFKDGRISYDQFISEVDSKYTDYVKIHKTTLSMFPETEKKESMAGKEEFEGLGKISDSKDQKGLDVYFSSGQEQEKAQEEDPEVKAPDILLEVKMKEDKMKDYKLSGHGASEKITASAEKELSDAEDMLKDEPEEFDLNEFLKPTIESKPGLPQEFWDQKRKLVDLKKNEEEAAKRSGHYEEYLAKKADEEREQSKFIEFREGVSSAKSLPEGEVKESIVGLRKTLAIPAEPVGYRSVTGVKDWKKRVAVSPAYGEVVYDVPQKRFIPAAAEKVKAFGASAARTIRGIPGVKRVVYESRPMFRRKPEDDW